MVGEPHRTGAAPASEELLDRSLALQKRQGAQVQAVQVQKVEDEID